MKISILLVLMLFLTTACGGKDSSNKRETPISESQIQEVMDNQNFECASLGGSCPSGIARLLIINRTDPNRSAVCSGFMVTATRLVTNHHCVPTATQCENTYIAIYTGGSYEQTRCKSIVRTEQDVDDPNDPTRRIDFTVMEIENTYTGDTLDLSPTLATPGDIVHSWVVDQTGLDEFPSNLSNSRITEFECLVMDQSERASLMMIRCPIISGNSGSPALNSEGEVIGVIWGGSATSIDSSFDLDLRRQLDAVGLVTEVNFFRNFVTP